MQIFSRTNVLVIGVLVVLGCRDSNSASTAKDDISGADQGQELQPPTQDLNQPEDLAGVAAAERWICYGGGNQHGPYPSRQACESRCGYFMRCYNRTTQSAASIEAEQASIDGTPASESSESRVNPLEPDNEVSVGAAARQWCRYGPGVFGGDYLKSRHNTRQECLDARTFNDRCVQC